MGRVIDYLRESELAQNTYVIFTTDNGPWLQFKHHGGSAGPLRAGKGTTFEGGQRVPCVMWAPGRIPADTTCDQLCGTIDLLPTIASLTNSALPTDRKIDGLDISTLLTAQEKSPRDEFLYYSSNGILQGIRQGPHKLLVIGPRNLKKNPKQKVVTYLFNLESDLGEQNNLAANQPELVAKLLARMKELDAEITQNMRQPWMKNE